jgi:transposase InsO family protein
MGIRDHPTAPRSPWQNGHVERLMGSIRRESLDHLVVFDEAHLRRVLKNYASYYNQIRSALGKADDDRWVRVPSGQSRSGQGRNRVLRASRRREVRSVDRG